MMRQVALHLSTLLLLLLLLVAHSSASSVNYGGVAIVYPDDAHTRLLSNSDSPTMRYSPVQSYWVMANVSLFPGFVTCADPAPGSMHNRIVLFSFGDYCSPQQKVVKMARAGAIGALHTEVSAVPSDWDALSRDRAWEGQVTIPVNMIDRELGLYYLLQTRLARGLNVTVVMTPQPSNLVAAGQHPGFIFMQVSLAACFFGVFMSSLIKFVLFIRLQGGFKFSLPQIALLSCIICSAFDFVAVAVDPLGVRGVWDNVTHVFMRDFSILIPIVPALIFPFYWGELVATTQPIAGLKASRIPFIIAGLLFFAMTFSVSLIRGLYGNNVNALLAMVSIALIIYFLVAVFFIVAGIRVLLMLRTMQDGKRTPVQTRMTILVLVCGAFLIMWCLSFVTILHTTTSWAGGLIGLYFSLWYICAGMQITITAVLSPQAAEATAASAVASSAVSMTSSSSN